MITRSTFMKTPAVGAAVATAGLAVPAIASGAKIKLGYANPQSRPLAPFSDANPFILDGFAKSESGKNFEVIVKDSQDHPAKHCAGEA